VHGGAGARCKSGVVEDQCIVVDEDCARRSDQCAGCLGDISGTGTEDKTSATDVAEAVDEFGGVCLGAGAGMSTEDGSRALMCDEAYVEGRVGDSVGACTMMCLSFVEAEVGARSEA
jgi:hypothetical protein